MIAYRVPVRRARCPGVLGRDINIAPQVEAYGAGWVVPADPGLLADTIINALRDRESRRAVGQAGRRLVREGYDGETVAREMLKPYEECLR